MTGNADISFRESLDSDMSYSLNSLKWNIKGIVWGTNIGAIKGDTRSLDYCSYLEVCLELRSLVETSFSTLPASMHHSLFIAHFFGNAHESRKLHVMSEQHRTQVTQRENDESDGQVAGSSECLEQSAS